MPLAILFSSESSFLSFDAEQAVRRAAAEIPAKVCERLDTAAQLSDEDRATIIEIARKALSGFSPEPGPKSEVLT